MTLPDRFILYKLVAKADSPKHDKVPCNRAGENINPHDPSQWMTQSAATVALQGSAASGVGFVFNGDGWFGLDLDGCRDPLTGQWSAESTAIYQSFNGALAEVSVSGTGLHIYGRCDPARLTDRRNKWGGDKEWYHTDRFFALGPQGVNPIGDAFVDRDWTDQLFHLVPQRDFMGELPEGVDPSYTGPQNDDELLPIMLRSGGAASKFGAGVTVADLWNANVAVLGRAYPAIDGVGDFDHSSADAALMLHLAFWTGRDMPRMDRLFRWSALMREKYAKREDYRASTISGAARMCKKVYDRPRAPLPTPSEPQSERNSVFYSAAQLEGQTVQVRPWLVPDLVPSNTVTLFSGDGGTGKSLVALQLAVAVATGTNWLGQAVRNGPVIFMSAEDDNDELHRRLSDILRTLNSDFSNCGKLTLRSLAGEDALLASDANAELCSSPLFAELENRARDDKPALIVIDTLADVYPANENDRAKVRQFIGILRGLAIRCNCAVLLLAHPSLTGLSNKTGSSGSTAWNNSVRSRLYLEREVSDGYEDDTRKRILSVKKSNYGETGQEIVMTWHSGVFSLNSVRGAHETGENLVKVERVFLFLLGIFTAQGRNVNHVSGQNYAPTLFAAHPNSEGIRKPAFKTAMERLLSARKVEIATVGPQSKRRNYLKLTTIGSMNAP